MFLAGLAVKNIVSFLDLQFLLGQGDTIRNVDNLKERMIYFQVDTTHFSREFVQSLMK